MATKEGEKTERKPGKSKGGKSKDKGDKGKDDKDKKPGEVISLDMFRKK